MPIDCLHTACFEITYHIVFLHSSLFQLIRLNNYDLILQFPTIFFQSFNRKTRNSFQSIVENLMACTEHVSAHLRHSVNCRLVGNFVYSKAIELLLSTRCRLTRFFPFEVVNLFRKSLEKKTWKKRIKACWPVPSIMLSTFRLSLLRFTMQVLIEFCFYFTCESNWLVIKNCNFFPANNFSYEPPRNWACFFAEPQPVFSRGGGFRNKKTWKFCRIFFENSPKKAF